MAYQIRIKKPHWEVESLNNDAETIILSARNTGLASFVTIPALYLADELLRHGFLIVCDSEGRFCGIADKIDPLLPLHG